MLHQSFRLTRSALDSQIVRNLVGQRVLDLTESFNSDSEGNIITRVFSLGTKLVGFVVGALFNFVRWTLVDLWEFAVEAYFELKFFDWNQTDAEIQRQLRANDAIIAGALGRLAGTGLVWLTGVAVSTGLSAKFPVIAGRLALEIAEEGGQEVRSALSNLLLVSRNVQVQNFLMNSLLNIRRFNLFNQTPVTQEKKPWTIAEQIDESIQRISSTKLRAFVENFADSVEDSIIELGYVVAFTLDDHFAAQQRANQSTFGTVRTVELTPDERVENERLVLEAPQELIIPSVQNALANHQFVHNRDIGQIIGAPEEDYFSPQPQRRKLTIVYRSVKNPPWKDPDGQRAKIVTCNIPDLRPGLSWERLKRGIPRFTWGRHRVTAQLTNGRQMTINAVSRNEGVRTIEELIKLSTTEIQRIRGGEEVRNIQQNRLISTPVFPAHCKLILGDVNANGHLVSNRRQTFRFDIWPQNEPDNIPPLL